MTLAQLHQFIDQLQISLNQLDDAINTAWFLPMQS
jgi:hypothetical protein